MASQNVPQEQHERTLSIASHKGNDAAVGSAAPPSATTADYRKRGISNHGLDERAPFVAKT